MSAKMNRRALIAAVPAFGFGLATVQAGTERADPHPEWLAEWRVICDAWTEEVDACDGETPRSDALWAERIALEDRLIETPATTNAGRRAQLDWLLEDAGGDFSRAYHARLLAALRDSFAA